MLDPVDLAKASHTGRRDISDMFIIAKSCIYLHAKIPGGSSWSNFLSQ